MKKKVLTLVLPLLVGVTIVGTGFSLFYFTVEGGTTQKLDVDIDVQAYAEIGNLQIKYPENAAQTSNGLKLNVDSTVDGGIKLMALSSSFPSSYVDCNDIDLTYQVNDNLQDTSDTYAKVPQIQMDVSVPADVHNYVDIKLVSDGGSDSVSWTTDAGDPSTPSSTDPVVYSYVQKLAFPTLPTTDPIDIALPDFSFDYQNGKEPMDYAAYEAMTSAMNGKTVSIVYTLSWVDDNSTSGN